jgi:ribosomal protein S18 acetylase RimI-like enzyme
VTLEVPAHPDVAAWRAATTDDIDGIWALERAMGAVDHPNYLATRDEIAEDFGFSHVHPGTDSIVGLDGDGTVVAYGMSLLPPGQATLVRAILLGGVHPALRGRGIGRQLLRWQVGRAKQQLASSPSTLPGWIITRTDERSPQNARLLERQGFRLARYFFSLERKLEEPVRSYPLPDGIRLEPYRPDLAGAVLEARNEAFMDHWASQPASEEMWEASVGSEVFRADLSFVAVAAADDGTEEVAGFLLASVNEDDWQNQGFTGSYIDLVGVRRKWRGRHIAQALLAAHLEGCRALGFERATLDVDADSPTGALSLYSGMGFYQVQRDRAYTIEF